MTVQFVAYLTVDDPDNRFLAGDIVGHGVSDMDPADIEESLEPNEAILYLAGQVSSEPATPENPTGGTSDPVFSPTEIDPSTQKVDLATLQLVPRTPGEQQTYLEAERLRRYLETIAKERDRRIQEKFYLGGTSTEFYGIPYLTSWNIPLRPENISYIDLIGFLAEREEKRDNLAPGETLDGWDFPRLNWMLPNSDGVTVETSRRNCLLARQEIAQWIALHHSYYNGLHTVAKHNGDYKTDPTADEYWPKNQWDGFDPDNTILQVDSTYTGTADPSATNLWFPALNFGTGKINSTYTPHNIVVVHARHPNITNADVMSMKFWPFNKTPDIAHVANGHLVAIFSDMHPLGLTIQDPPEFGEEWEEYSASGTFETYVAGLEDVKLSIFRVWRGITLDRTIGNFDNYEDWDDFGGNSPVDGKLVVSASFGTEAEDPARFDWREPHYNEVLYNDGTNDWRAVTEGFITNGRSIRETFPDTYAVATYTVEPEVS